MFEMRAACCFSCFCFLCLHDCPLPAYLIVNMKGAVISYSLIIFSLYYFIIKDKKEPLDAFFLGLSIYGIFDGTNIAIFKDYDSNIAYVDMIWGGILYALTTYLFNII